MAARDAVGGTVEVMQATARRRRRRRHGGRDGGGDGGGEDGGGAADGTVIGADGVTVGGTVVGRWGGSAAIGTVAVIVATAGRGARWHGGGGAPATVRASQLDWEWVWK